MKCSPGFFKRVNYFNGMLLTEQDFADEQNYIREKLKLHNRLYGTGVVWGLSLKKDCVKVGSEEITKIFIRRGIALDCAGNEIIVCEDYLVPLDEKIDELRKFGLLKRVEECQPPQYEGPPLCIGIRYCECKSQPAEQYTSECAEDKLRPQFSRIREGFSVEIFNVEELPCCFKPTSTGETTGSSQPCPDCYGLHPCADDEQIIILGCVDNYDVGIGGEPNHADATITPSENYPPSPAYRRWEVQRQKTLQAVFEKTEWIDVSVLICERVTKIEERMHKMGLKVGQTYVPGSIGDMQMFLERAKRAQPWAAPESTVDIVTDLSGTCVTFLFVNPPFNGNGGPAA
jgi:hypothetical protein